MTRMTARGWGRAGALVGAGVAAGAAGVAGYTSWLLSGPYRPWPDYTFTPFEVGVPAEDVTFPSADGVRLAGWWFDDPDASVTVVVCHGHRSDKSEMLGIGPGLHKAGHAVLLFDFRGSGESDDGPRSLAHYEQADLRGAIDWVLERRPGTRVAVVAFSMGAATALLEAADDPRVDALVLDSPFATMRDVVDAGFRRYRLPFSSVLPLVDLVTRVRHGYRFAQVRPIDAIGRLRCPVLLLHGTRDRVIPYAHALDLRDAGRPGAVDLVTFEGADHCGGYFADRPGYIARVDAWLRAQLT